MNNIIACRETPLSEIEVQKIVQKLARGLNSMYERNIMHRDLNINNVMLHFPELEPTDEELQDPHLLQKLEAIRLTKFKNLVDVDFNVKIIDFGLSTIISQGDVAKTPCGTVEVIAPEALGPGSDHRVDVWGLGLIAYMIFTCECMFNGKQALHEG